MGQIALGDGLILRSLGVGVESDRQGLPTFFADVFAHAGDEDGGGVSLWTRDMLSGKHPTVSLDDVFVVVDSAKDDRIVSALTLIPQIWRYEDVEFGVGRVELVATDKDYRKRGLIRALMDAAHERSAELGHLVQGITGIPHYYRKFGYGMAVDLGIRAAMNLDAIPPLGEDQDPKYTLRPATEDDIPDMLRWMDYVSRDYLLTTAFSAEYLRYEISYVHEDSTERNLHLIICNRDGKGVGFIPVRATKYEAKCELFGYVIGNEASVFDTFEDAMRGLKAHLLDYYQDRPEMTPTRVFFGTGIPETLEAMVRHMPSGTARETAYAWYSRVPDLPKFIETIAPALERRLKDSGANRFSGALKIGFLDFRGLTIAFEDGQFINAEMGEMDNGAADMRFPYDYFLNLLFGHRTIQEIWHILPEAYFNRNAAGLAPILFPKRCAWILPIS
jgi:GNAT superfamily N-acetyltransferase